MGGDKDVRRFFSCFQNDITHRFYDLCNWAWIFRNEMCQNKYIVTEYNSKKIVATVVCTEKKTILRIPPFPDKKETTFVYDGVAITTNSDEVYAECEKGKSYQAIIKIATHKKNGKKLYFLENVANEPVSENVNE